MAKTPKKKLDSEPPPEAAFKCDACGNIEPERTLTTCPSSRCRAGILRARNWIGWWNRAHEKEVRSEWMTPPELWEPLNAIFRFTLDVCASKENSLCRKFFSKEDSGLDADWGAHSCWMNPPGDDYVAWLRKASRAPHRGASVVAITNDDTSTDWFHDYALLAAEIYLLTPRVRFVPVEGIPESSNSSGSHLLVFRPQLITSISPMPRIIPYQWKAVANGEAPF